MVELTILALALAMDAAAVTTGLAAGGVGRRDLAVAAGVFGLAQGAMAGLGALGGAWLAATAAAWDHWVAFALLVGFGGRMLLGEPDEDVPRETVAPGPAGLAMLAVATSVDALAAGVGLPLLGLELGVAVAVVGGVTTACCAVAAVLGARVGPLLGVWAERVGGVVLIGIGLRIVVDHLQRGV